MQVAELCSTCGKRTKVFYWRVKDNQAMLHSRFFKFELIVTGFRFVKRVLQDELMFFN